MYHQEYAPPEELCDTIKCFWYNRRDSGEIQSCFEVVPDGYAEIIFHFGSDLSISYNGSLQPLPSPFMMGLLNQPVVFHAKNRLEIIGIRCFPWTVFDLLGLQPGKGGVRIFEHPIARLQPELNELIHTGKIDQALVAVKQYFLNARLDVANSTMLFKAGTAMRDANGTLPVNEVAAAAHGYGTTQIPTLPAWPMSWVIPINPISAGNSNAIPAPRRLHSRVKPRKGNRR
jgi:hypothetical protein